MKKINISLLAAIVVGAILYYFALPPINVHSFSFWMWICVMLIVFATVNLSFELGKFTFNFRRGFFVKTFNKNSFVPLYAFFGILLVILLVNFGASPLFTAKSYSRRINVRENGIFAEDVKEVDPNSLPLLDKISSTKLGDRVMGQMPEMVSQFYVADDYDQINYNNNIVRVTPLEYNGLFKYINNHKNGVTGYITVNSVNGNSKLVKLDKGMKYMPSAYLNKDLNRKLRFSYPFDIFGEINFEIDDDGNPYWVAPVMKYTAVGLKRDVKAVVLLDPITGNSKKYDFKYVPKWVDHVYEADLIIEQVDDWGRYKGGFFNSIFGQKNVVMTTRGYNYTVMNDDVYLYTGITSVSNDQANIGFIMSNLRTKETTYYPVPGAEEYSAMASAEGQVQQMKYIATFPLLINLNNKPTYLMSLKDNAGLVKQYALVDVVDYQKVVVTDASKGIDKAFAEYLENSDTNSSGTDITKEITIKKINTASIDGNTYYYIIDTDNKKYKVSIKKNKNLLPFLETGNKVTISYKSEKEITDLTSISN